MKRFGTLLSLLILAACQSNPSSPPPDSSDPPNPATPSLTLTPTSININAGDAPVTFVATVQNSTEMVTWIYSGTGSISPTSGPATSYTPPSSVTEAKSESLTAVLGSTGVTAVASIAVYPLDETPPPDPTDASDPTDPTDPTDATDPTDPDPTDPDPTTPDPTNPTTTYTLTVTSPESGKIISTDADDGIDCGSDCTAVYPAGSAALLTAIPLEGWEVDSWGDDCSGNVGVANCTLSMDADKTASITFKLGQPTVSGTWDAVLAGEDFTETFTFDLEQNGEAVTGNWNYLNGAYPLTGTFDGTNLKLKAIVFGVDQNLAFTVNGDNMSGTLSHVNGAFNVTATRRAP